MRRIKISDIKVNEKQLQQVIQQAISSGNVSQTDYSSIVNALQNPHALENEHSKVDAAWKIYQAGLKDFLLDPIEKAYKTGAITDEERNKIFNQVQSGVDAAVAKYQDLQFKLFYIFSQNKNIQMSKPNLYWEIHGVENLYDPSMERPENLVRIAMDTSNSIKVANDEMSLPSIYDLQQVLGTVKVNKNKKLQVSLNEFKLPSEVEVLSKNMRPDYKQAFLHALAKIASDHKTAVLKALDKSHRQMLDVKQANTQNAKIRFLELYMQYSGLDFLMLGLQDTKQSLSDLVLSVPIQQIPSFVKMQAQFLKPIITYESKGKWVKKFYKKDLYLNTSEQRSASISYSYNANVLAKSKILTHFTANGTYNKSYHLHSLLGQKHFSQFRDKELGGFDIKKPSYFNHFSFLNKGWENFVGAHDSFIQTDYTHRDDWPSYLKRAVNYNG